MRRGEARGGMWLAGAVLAIGLALGASDATAANGLLNPAFDAAATLTEWSQQGTDYGTVDLATDSVVSSPNALHVEIGANGSSGEQSIMAYQIIADRAVFAGKTTYFGARIRTRGAGVNLLLFTPEGSGNRFDPGTESSGFVTRSSSFEVPAQASMLLFGIQVFGVPGGEVWVDDAYVALEEPPLPTPDGGAAGARVQLDTARADRQVNPLLFGMGIEWVKSGHGLLEAQEDRLRTAVLDLLKPLYLPLLRFPGGILADYYDWKLGDGPAESRGTSENPFDLEQEKHRFGTPEFVDLMGELGADALITANYGTGTPTMAGEWAKRFVELGVSPKYWEVGNEIYLSGPNQEEPNGATVWHTPEQYAADFPGYRDAIRNELPDAKVGIIAHVDTGAYSLAPVDNPDWTTKMLTALQTRADFVAVHNAFAPVIRDDSADFTTDEGRRRVYGAMYSAALQVRDNLNQVSTTVAMLSPINAGLPIAVTEFGPLFGVSTKPEVHQEYIDQSRTLAAAIYTASVLDVLISDPRVAMAAYMHPIHRWYSSLLTDTEGGLVLTPTYHLYELYRTRFESRLISTDIVTSPSFSTSEVGIGKARNRTPDLLAKGSISETGRRLTVMLVHRSFDATLGTVIETKGFAARTVDCLVMTAPTPDSINGPAVGSTVTSRGEGVLPAPIDCTVGPSTITISIPPNSIVSVVARS